MKELTVTLKYGDNSFTDEKLEEIKRMFNETNIITLVDEVVNQKSNDAFALVILRNCDKPTSSGGVRKLAEILAELVLFGI